MIQKKHLKKSKLFFFLLFCILQNISFGQDYLINNNDNVLEYIKMLVYNDLFYKSYISISRNYYNCLIDNSYRIMSFDTIDNNIENLYLIRVTFKSKEELRLEYFKNKDCFFEIAHILYIADNNIFYPNSKYLIAVWGTGVYKLKGFLKDDTDYLINNIVSFNVQKDNIQNVQRENKIKKYVRKKRIKLRKEIKVLENNTM